MGGRLWRAAELEVAREMMLAGSTCEEMAAALDRTPGAVRTKLYTAFGVGVKRKGGASKRMDDSWEAFEFDLEHSLGSYYGCIEIAKEMGVWDSGGCGMAPCKECSKRLAAAFVERAKSIKQKS